MKPILYLALLSITKLAVAASYVFDPQRGEVVFLAKGKPALIKIEGKGAGVSGEVIESETGISGEIHFDLSSLGTGIELRDQHMKEKYLEVEKFPKATLVLRELKVPETSETFKFNGEMEIKGVKKPVHGEAVVKRNGSLVQVDAEFPIQISDYPIGVPSYLGVTVAETVKVNIKAIAALKD